MESVGRYIGEKNALEVIAPDIINAFPAFTFKSLALEHWIFLNVEKMIKKGEESMEFKYDDLTKKEQKQYDSCTEKGKKQYEKDWILLQQQKHKMQENLARDSKKARAERTHRLVQLGAEVESILGQITPEELKSYLLKVK